MFENSVNLIARDRPVRPGAGPATSRLFNPQNIPRSEMLEHTIARIEREFRGSSPPLASGRSAEPMGPPKPQHPSHGQSERRATNDRCR